MKQRYGNTLHSIRGGIIGTSILGIIAASIGLVALHVYGTEHESLPVLLLLLAPVGCFMLACAPTLAFSIQIEDERVRHVFMDRHVLSDLPIAQFEKIETMSAPFGAVLYFRHRRAIRFYGASLGVLSRLRTDLQQKKKEANQPPETRPTSRPVSA